MAKTADARNHHGLSGPGVGFLQPLVDGDPSAKHWRGGGKFHRVRQVADIVRIGKHVVRETAIHAIAGILLFGAERFPAAHAVATMAAGGIKPRDADAVAFLDAFDVAPDLGDGADTFMAGDEGRAWLHRPVALRRVQIGVANATCRDLDDDPGVGERRAFDLADIERLSEFPNDGCFHHGALLFVTDIGSMSASLDNRVSENHENHAKRIGGDL